MSYSFVAASSTLGTFTSTYTDPLTLACFVKVTAHPSGIRTALSVGVNNGSVAESYSLRTTATLNQYAAAGTDSGSTASTAVRTQSIDGVWAGLVGVFTTDSNRDIYVQAVANTSNNTTSRAVGAVQYVRVGQDNATATDWNIGLIAEVAIWNTVISQAAITQYLAGTRASVIYSSNLIGYWPLDTANTTQANEGLDSGGDLTLAGTPATFNADHPPPFAFNFPVLHVLRYARQTYPRLPVQRFG